MLKGNKNIKRILDSVESKRKPNFSSSLIMRLRLAPIAVFVLSIAKASFMFYVKSPMKHRKHVICVENESYAIFAGINNAITAQK